MSIDSRRGLTLKGLILATSPGLLMAGGNIGVSHLVQSTRAGAAFGFQLVILVLAVNLAKYPFYEYGHRYAAVRGESLLHGYLRLGRWALYLYLLVHTGIGVVGTAAILLVTAAMAQSLFGWGLSATFWSALILIAGLALVLVGRIRTLDVTIKLMLIVLLLTTLLALLAAAAHGPVAPEGFESPSPWQAAHLGFLIALMGWMPGGLETSVLQSLWLGAGDAASGRRTSLPRARLDFHIGYGLSTAMAIVFIGLGALVMHGSGESFSSSGAVFASQFVGLYGLTLGDWIRPVVSGAALATMLSTTLIVLEGYPRSLAMSVSLLKGDTNDSRLLHRLWMIGNGVAALVLLHGFRAHFIQLIDVITTVSFLTAPVIAYLNMRIVSEHLSEEARPGPALRLLAVLGLISLGGFGVLFLLVRTGVWAG